MPASFLFLDWRADQRGVQRREVAPCSSCRLLGSVRRLLPGRGGRDVHHVRDGEVALATEPSKDLRPAGGGSGPSTPTSTKERCKCGGDGEPMETRMETYANDSSRRRRRRPRYGYGRAYPLRTSRWGNPRRSGRRCRGWSSKRRRRGTGRRRRGASRRGWSASQA